MISVKQFTDQLIHSLPNVPSTLAVALSGGVDSMCLTYLLSQYKKYHDVKLNIIAFTIDHKYRPESSEEARKIGSIVRKWGVKHVIQALDYSNEELRDIKEKNNFETIARFKRYEALQTLCRSHKIKNILLGHNLNDQLETYVQRKEKSSTVFGLRGMSARSILPLPAEGPYKYYPPVHLIRPLLVFDKRDIVQTCKNSHIEWFEDSTNEDTLLTSRNKIRKIINETTTKIDHMRQRLSSENEEESRDMLYKDIRKLTRFDKELIKEATLQASDEAHRIEERSFEMRRRLENCGDIHLNHELGRIECRLPVSDLKTLNELVFSRFLFQLVYPISPTVLYHFKFSLMKQFTQKLLSSIESTDKRKFTFFNLNWNINVNSNWVNMDINRQNVYLDNPSIKHFILTETEISKEWSKWVFFDNRFWFRFRSVSNTRVKIILYTDPNLYKQKILGLLKDFGMKMPKFEKLRNIPMLLHSDSDEVVGLPTLNILKNGFEAEWYLKDNYFDELAPTTMKL